MIAGLGAALEREHRAIDEGLELLTAGGADVTGRRAAVNDAIALLRRHIYLEEEYLFPPLRAAGLVGPVMVMVHEHGRMWPLLDRLEQLVSAADDTAATLTNDLLAQLAAHNTKEEHILYPQADTLLDEAERDDLVDFQATGDMPAGWVCQGYAEALR